MRHLRTLKKRREFLRAARGRRLGHSAFTLQSVETAEPEPGVGYTVTKKTGNAPERNRIKRRLRAAVKACATGFEPRHDYVLLGRREALAIPFPSLVSDLSQLLTRIHAIRPKAAGPQRPPDDEQ